MPTIELNDARCRKAAPIGGQVTEYADKKQRGLALRVSPPSVKNPAGTKSWTIRYRTKSGQQRRISLGGYPVVSLSKARDKALAVLASVADGADPVAENKETRARARAARLDTLRGLGERYFEEAQKGRHKPNGRAKRSSTLALERSYFDRHVEREFGDRPVSEITRAELQVFVNKLADKHSPSAARHCRVVFQRLFAFARWQEITDSNPAQFVHVPDYKSRERILTDAELKVIWQGTEPPIPDTYYLSPGIALALRLATLTLQRRSEVAGMHTDEIDREARTWTIPGARTKNHRTHVVPLSDAVLAVIDQALELCGGAEVEVYRGYVFPSPRSSVKPVQPGALSLAFYRMAKAIGLQDVRTHDLRRTGSTNITSERIGIPRFIVSRVLNQVSDTGGAATVTSVYDRHEYMSEKRRALDAWAALLQSIVTGAERPKNVVLLAAG